MSLQLQHLREKIDTARNLLGVVETMRGLAAVNIRRAEAVAEQAQAYARTIHLSLHAALMHMDPFGRWGREENGASGASARRGAVDSSDGLSGKSFWGTPTFLVVSTDMGLCGQFNERIAEYAMDLARRFSPLDGAGRGASATRGAAAVAGGEHGGASATRGERGGLPGRWIVVGMRGLERLAAEGAMVVDRLDAPGSVEAIPGTVARAFLAVQRVLTEEGAGPLLVVYNRPDEEAIFAGRVVQLFPFQPGRWERLPEGESPWRAVPLTSPESEAMLPLLIREQVYIDLYRAFTDSFAAENGARLASMKNATDNIDELLEELEGEYRRERQDAITTELMELLSGVEAVRAAAKAAQAAKAAKTGKMAKTAEQVVERIAKCSDN